MPNHWHISTGLNGLYIPDSVEVVDDVETAAEICREILDRSADACDSYAHDLGANEEYQAAWQTITHAETLSTLVLNLDPSRAAAPLYVDDRNAWRETLARLLVEEVDGTGLDLADGWHVLNVYACSFDECAPLDDEEADEVDEPEAEPLAHVWHVARFTGAMTCERCGLLPLDDDDVSTACEPEAGNDE